MTRVALRKLPGTLILGLLASLTAHTVVYGDQHVLGGTFHEALLAIAGMGFAGLGLLVISLAWAGSRHAADGSILGCRLATCLPSLAGLVTATIAWYLLVERLEPHHAAAPAALVFVCLTLAAALLLALSRRLLALLAEVIFVVAQPAHAPRLPRRHAEHDRTPLLPRRPFARRRYARPPPSIA